MRQSLGGLQMELQSLILLAKKFKTRNEFKKAHINAYSKVIRTTGWREKVFAHMEQATKRNPNRPNITDEEAINTALKYASIKELRKHDASVYRYIKIHKHLKSKAYSHIKGLRNKTKFNFPNKQNKGLYFLLQDNLIVYVGKSVVNITNRLNQHTLNKTFNTVEIYTMENESDIAIMEIYFITKYKPKYNIESQNTDKPTIAITNFIDMYIKKYTINIMAI